MMDADGWWIPGGSLFMQGVLEVECLWVKSY